MDYCIREKDYPSGGFTDGGRGVRVYWDYGEKEGRLLNSFGTETLIGAWTWQEFRWTLQR